MASAIQIPVSEYMESTYQPDCEYVDGEVLERNVGKWSHARVQWLLALWFGSHETAWNVIGSTEQRIQVSPTRIRVPDLVVLRPGPQPDVLVEPPLLIIEILSPDDSYTGLQQRCQDYLAMGVKTVWIIDPNTRSGRMCLHEGWVAAERLEVAGTPVHVELGQLFLGWTRRLPCNNLDDTSPALSITFAQDSGGKAQRLCHCRHTLIAQSR